MFPVGKANFCSNKNAGFLVDSGHKTAAAILSDSGKGGFCCVGRDAALAYNADDGGGGERRRRTI